MKEVIVKNNTTGLQIFINGRPNLQLIPKDEAECVISALEMQIAEFYKEKIKCSITDFNRKQVINVGKAY